MIRLAVVGLLALAVAPAARQAPSQGHIAYEATRGIATISPSGGRSQFVKGLEHMLDPAWSPDGTRLAFVGVAYDGGLWEVGVCNADGSHRRWVARTDGIAASPSWSPDGRFIAYADDSAIYVVPAMGGHRRRVATASLSWTVAWSPDGKRIAFGNTPGADSGDADIVLVDPDGKHRRILVQGNTGQPWGGIGWSPDSRTLAVTEVSYEGGDKDGNPDLYLVDARTGHAREFYWGGTDPSFAPDGKHIAITDVTTYGAVAIVTVASAGARVLVQGQNPSWSSR